MKTSKVIRDNVLLTVNIKEKNTGNKYNTKGEETSKHFSHVVTSLPGLLRFITEETVITVTITVVTLFVELLFVIPCRKTSVSYLVVEMKQDRTFKLL